MTVYVDSSAAAKLLVREQESAALIRHLSDRQINGDGIATSFLTETELRRICVREDISQKLVTDLLDRFELLELDAPLYRDAGTLANRELRSLDALHIATALRLDADEFVTYDQRQTSAALDSGLRVVAPA